MAFNLVSVIHLKIILFLFLKSVLAFDPRLWRVTLSSIATVTVLKTKATLQGSYVDAL